MMKVVKRYLLFLLVCSWIGAIANSSPLSNSSHTKSLSFGFSNLLGIAVAEAAEPVADAGQDTAVSIDAIMAASATLDASASYDADNDSLSYQWYGPFGVANGITPTVTIPEGAYSVSLRVHDGASRSAVDTVRIVAQPSFIIAPRAKASKLTLTWTHQDGTVRYDVYRADGATPSEFVKIGDTTSTYSMYLDILDVLERDYLYLVAALDSNGDWHYSNTVSTHITSIRGLIDRPPIIYSTPILKGIVGIEYNYDVNGTDTSGAVLTYSLNSAPSGMIIDESTGLISWTPNTSGDFQVVVEVEDQTDNTTTQGYSIVVSNIDADFSVVRHGNEDGPAQIEFAVELAEVNDTGGDISFDVAPVGGTATPALDYGDFSGSQILVSNGSLSGKLVVPVVDDSSYEGIETIQARISNPSILEISINASSAIAQIIDDDPIPDDDGDGLPNSQECLSKDNCRDTDKDGIPDYLDVDDDNDGILTKDECSDYASCQDSDGDGIVDYLQQTEKLHGTFYTVWNSFFNQINILAFINKTAEPVRLKTTLLDSLGREIAEKELVLKGFEEFDVILNGLEGFPLNTYGLVLITSNRPEALDGHYVAYQIDQTEGLSLQSNASRIGFVITQQFKNASIGESYAFFNTFQPSRNNLEADFVVPHWLQIGNLTADTEKKFSIKKYDVHGVEIESVDVLIPPFGRKDVEAGHAVPGARSVGLVKIVPEDFEAPYVAQVFHYGYNCIAGERPSSFSFAMGERARPASWRSDYLNVTSGMNAQNWITIANVGDSRDSVSLAIYANDGSEVMNQELLLDAKSQRHISTNHLLSVNQSGVAVVTPSSSGQILTQSRLYYYASDGSIKSASLTEGVSSLGNDVFGSYNTFLDQQNWISVFNTSDSILPLTIVAHDLQGKAVSSALITVNPRSGIDLELQHSLGSSIQENGYGAFRLTSSDGENFYSMVRQLKLSESTLEVDFTKSLPLR